MRANILLVEDEEAMRMVLSDRLRSEGYVVDSVPDGEAGFRKATSRPFDLMIFDIMLPHRSGLDLCRDVRSVGLGTPILLLSAYQQTAVKTLGFEVGADDWVTKPFDMRELKARVEALLRRTAGSRSDSRRAHSLALVATNGSCGLSAAGLQGSDGSLVSQESSKLPNEFDPRSNYAKDFSQLAAVIPQLRKILNEEQQGEQTPCKAAWLKVSDGIIEFLEELLQ